VFCALVASALLAGTASAAGQPCPTMIAENGLGIADVKAKRVSCRTARFVIRGFDRAFFAQGKTTGTVMDRRDRRWRCRATEVYDPELDSLHNAVRCTHRKARLRWNYVS
jgi:hypothetical protein